MLVRKQPFIWRIKGCPTGEVPRESIVNVHKQVADKSNNSCDPKNETKEGDPEAASSSVAKIVVIVNMERVLN